MSYAFLVADTYAISEMSFTLIDVDVWRRYHTLSPTPDGAGGTDTYIVDALEAALNMISMLNAGALDCRACDC